MSRLDGLDTDIPFALSGGSTDSSQTDVELLNGKLSILLPSNDAGTIGIAGVLPIQ